MKLPLSVLTKTPKRLCPSVGRLLCLLIVSLQLRLPARRFLSPRARACLTPTAWHKSNHNRFLLFPLNLNRRTLLKDARFALPIGLKYFGGLLQKATSPDCVFPFGREKY